MESVFYGCRGRNMAGMKNVIYEQKIKSATWTTRVIRALCTADTFVCCLPQITGNIYGVRILQTHMGSRLSVKIKHAEY